MTNTILSPLQMFFFCSESSAAFSLLYYRNHFCVKNWCRHSAWRDDRLLSVKQAPGSIKSFVLVEELLSSNSRLTFLQELSKCYRVLSGDGKQKGRRRRKKSRRICLLRSAAVWWEMCFGRATVHGGKIKSNACRFFMAEKH